MNRKFRNTALGAVAAVFVAAGCDRSPVSPPDHNELGQVVILDRSTIPHTPIATWTHGAGWDTQDLITVSHATEDHRTRVSLGARMYTRGGEEITLSSAGEYSFRYGVQSDPDNVIDMDVAANLFHGDHVHIYGYHESGRTGTAEILFGLWHGDHDDGLTSPIRITFVD